MPHQPIKKLSHKDVSGLSMAEFLDTAKVPFLRLRESHLDPRAIRALPAQLDHEFPQL